MNLKNGQITLTEICRNPAAHALLKEELPQAMASPLVRLAGGMTLSQLLSFAKGSLPQEQVDRILKGLEAL